MANLQATIRTEAFLLPQPCECLNRTNFVLYQNTEANKFATLFYAVLNTKTHNICYSNAGHNRPLLVRSSGKKNELKTAGVVLSMLENFNYSEDEITINPGDLLIIYSDGITESLNENDEEYGEERLGELAIRLKDKSARDLVDQVIDNINEFSGKQPQFDDMTLMVIKRE
ncbi:SpoIIE family protein phosphatase, partial [candidate division KSB1 bacterium]|nr:SpoIIE family protein phosphatase [candidate division KSB1 bacterium]